MKGLFSAKGKPADVIADIREAILREVVKKEKAVRVAASNSGKISVN